MTPDQLREKLTDRRSELHNKIAERSAIIKDLVGENRIDIARVEEIAWALEALDIAPGSSPEAKPEKPKAEKRDTLAECIAAFRKTFMFPLRDGVTDRMAQEQLAKAGHKFRLPTIRRALAEIGKELRSVSAADDTLADARVDPLDIPPNLRRPPSRNAAE